MFILYSFPTYPRAIRGGNDHEKGFAIRGCWHNCKVILDNPQLNNEP